MWRLASITEPLVHFATNLMNDIGLAGLFVLMMLESACIPIPSEATMLFAGFNTSGAAGIVHHWSLLEITLVGSVANLVGSWIAYGVGYCGRIELLEKHGRKLHISPTQLARADRWFERYGSAAVFFSRMLPIVRTFISLPAGVARMPFIRFSVLTFLGCVPWVLMLGFVGQQVGGEWPKWRHNLEYVDYAVGALIVAGLIYLLVRRARGGRSEPAADAPS
jgi:membrane protein DedA with SNARE-associated domain